MFGDVLNGQGKFSASIELVSPGAVAAFDGAVELGRSRRQDIESEVLFGAGLFEFGHELGSAIDLDRLHREGHLGDELVEEDGGGLGGGAVEGLPARPLLATESSTAGSG